MVPLFIETTIMEEYEIWHNSSFYREGEKKEKIKKNRQIIMVEF